MIESRKSVSYAVGPRKDVQYEVTATFTLIIFNDVR
jgi:hypothetical protein